VLFTIFILSFVSIGLSIVAFDLGYLVVLTLGVGIALTTLGVDGSPISIEIGELLATLGAAGCCSCGGFVDVSNVTRLFWFVADVSLAGILFNILSKRCRASISSMPFLFRRSFSASVKSFSAFTIVSSGVRVGSVMYLCLKCTVSDIRSLGVLFE
jgi:hypothetical protein